jgi:hypothetical protein
MLAALRSGQCRRVSTVPGLTTSPVISPDGRNVYVVTYSDTIVAFSRDPLTGTLTPLPGSTGRVSGSRREPCTLVRGLDFLSSLAVSRDGRSAYACRTEATP